MPKRWVVKKNREWIEVIAYYVIGMAILMSIMVLATW
jgi:hypothetical protein